MKIPFSMYTRTKPIRRRYGWQTTAIVTINKATITLQGWSEIGARGATTDLLRKIKCIL